MQKIGSGSAPPDSLAGFKRPHF